MLAKDEFFLIRTDFCNYDHYLIQAISRDLKRKSKDQRDYAVRAFYWVRDNIQYRLGSWNETASETIYNKEGTSTNKANVFVALLRANGIPSGYGMMKVNGKDFLESALTPMLAKNIGSNSIHIYAVIYMSRWIKVDPSDDIDLCNSLDHFHQTHKIVEWNGYDDSELSFKKNHILSDEFPIDNIDHIFNKKETKSSNINQKILNLCLNFYREKGKCISKDKNLKDTLLKYLLKNHPVTFAQYLAYSKITDLKKNINFLLKKTFNILGYDKKMLFKKL